MASSVYDCEGKENVEYAVIDIGDVAIKGGVTGVVAAAAGSLAAGVAGATLVTVGITCAAAPLAVGFAVAYLVGSFIFSLFD